MRWVLGTELEASVRVSSAPDCPAVPLAPVFSFCTLLIMHRLTWNNYFIIILLCITSGIENKRQPAFDDFFIIIIIFVVVPLTPLL